MTTGVWVLLGALVLATAVALTKRWYDGRFHAMSTGRRRTDGPVHEAGGATHPVVRLSAEELGAADLGERATLVQFSSAFCQPCRATRRVLSEISEAVPGVAHVEIDAESHLELVRRLGVLRTPTTLVLDPAGRVTTRASGQPRKEQVLSALPL